MGKKLLALITSLMTMVVLCGAPALAFASDNGVVKKEETVYVVTDSEGNTDDVIVSDHLVNEKQVKNISDETTLSDIENVKGDEKFKQKGDSLEWAAEGNDIYYQGKTDKEIPVQMNVIYRLDGKVISGDKLQGKSGDVEIRINYENNGKFEGKTVPFIVMTGLIVTDNSFTNLSVDHGKVIDDGDKQIVVGLAAPGLAQSLDLGANELGFGDTVTIKGKAKEFAVEDMMIIATNSVFEDLDTGDLADLDFDDEINQLNKGAEQLVDGSDQLYKGLNKMAAKAPALKAGTKKLSDGSKKLNGGAKQLSSQLSSKLTEVVQGESTIQTNLESVQNGITTGDPETGKPSLNSLVSNASEQATLAKTNGGAAASDLGAARQELGGIDISGLSESDQAAFADAMGKLKSATDEATAAATAGGTAEAYIAGINTGVQTISGALGNDTTDQTIIKGVSDIKKGLIDAMSEDGELSKGLKELTNGSEELANGTAKLDASADTLVNGTEKLASGSEELSQGIQKLYKEGIKKIVDLYNDDLKGLTKGLDNMMDAGKGYKSFTKLPSSMDGSVKFIYKTKITE